MYNMCSGNWFMDALDVRCVEVKFVNHVYAYMSVIALLMYLIHGVWKYTVYIMCACVCVVVIDSPVY